MPSETQSNLDTKKESSTLDLDQETKETKQQKDHHGISQNHGDSTHNQDDGKQLQKSDSTVETKVGSLVDSDVSGTLETTVTQKPAYDSDKSDEKSDEMDNDLVLAKKTKEKSISMRDLLDAGAHYGHMNRLLNPKAKKFVYGQINGISIINLQKTVDFFNAACKFVTSVTAGGSHVLFVGTKRQSGDIVKKEAVRSCQYYMNNRWLGGTLTNYPTIRKSIHKLKKIEKMSTDGTYEKLTKKEALNFDRLLQKIDANLSGIKNMPGLPGCLFITDLIKEKTALLEARHLNIPIVAVVDTNTDPSLVDYPIPGNDDSIKSLQLFVSTIADAALKGDKQYKLKKDPADHPRKKSRTFKSAKHAKGAKFGKHSKNKRVSSSFQSQKGTTVKVEKIQADKSDKTDS